MVLHQKVWVSKIVIISPRSKKESITENNIRIHVPSILERWGVSGWMPVISQGSFSSKNRQCDWCCFCDTKFIKPCGHAECKSLKALRLPVHYQMVECSLESKEGGAAFQRDSGAWGVW